ncbi:MAG: glycosyltransferase family 4 protein, partial [Caldilineaceae bacterium]|nr:glycosyltransferase family 4 protein [Caldilineaceae bacterium]
RSTAGLVRGILASPADIYHVGKPQPINGLAALVGICLLRGRRFYLDCDDDETHSNRLNRWQRAVFAFWERLTVQIAAGSTVNTRYLAARNRQAGHTHVVYVPNGVDLARFQLPAPDVVNGLRTALQLEGCPVVAYFGSLALQNHPVDLLLDAFVQVHRTTPETRLLVIGGGDDLALLQEMADGLGLGGVALFTGHVAQTALPELLALATVTVDPVHDNSVASARSPLKVFESLALGIPVVTADVGDRAELLQQGAAGVLVAPGDADALAQGILSVLGDEERRAAMGQAGRQHMRARYAWPRLAADWATLYAGETDQPAPHRSTHS